MFSPSYNQSRNITIMNDIFNLIIIIKFQYCHYVARRFFKMFDLKDCWMTRKERI